MSIDRHAERARLRVSLCAVLAVALLSAAPALAQTPGAAARDTSAMDDTGTPLGWQFGAAAGALHYSGGRDENTIGAIVRWAPVRFFALSANPTVIRQRVPLATGVGSSNRTGLADLPISATVSHAFDAAWSPTLSAMLSASLPVGDTTAGLGAGQAGYVIDVGADLSMTDELSLQLGYGRALSGFSSQSALTGGSDWLDTGIGYLVSPRISISAGYSADLAASAANGRSSSVTGSVSYAVAGPLSLNVETSRGVSGVSPAWSLAVGIGTAFPSLAHAVSTSLSPLRQTFGAGSHGLGKGTTTGKGTGGRRKNKP